MYQLGQVDRKERLEKSVNTKQKAKQSKDIRATIFDSARKLFYLWNGGHLRLKLINQVMKPSNRKEEV